MAIESIQAVKHMEEFKTLFIRSALTPSTSTGLSKLLGKDGTPCFEKYLGHCSSVISGINKFLSQMKATPEFDFLDVVDPDFHTILKDVYELVHSQVFLSPDETQPRTVALDDGLMTRAKTSVDSLIQTASSVAFKSMGSALAKCQTVLDELRKAMGGKAKRKEMKILWQNITAVELTTSGAIGAKYDQLSPYLNLLVQSHPGAKDISEIPYLIVPEEISGIGGWKALPLLKLLLVTVPFRLDARKFKVIGVKGATERIKICSEALNLMAKDIPEVSLGFATGFGELWVQIIEADKAATAVWADELIQHFQGELELKITTCKTNLDEMDKYKGRGNIADCLEEGDVVNEKAVLSIARSKAAAALLKSWTAFKSSRDAKYSTLTSIEPDDEKPPWEDKVTNLKSLIQESVAVVATAVGTCLAAQIIYGKDDDGNRKKDLIECKVFLEAEQVVLPPRLALAAKALLDDK